MSLSEEYNTSFVVLVLKKSKWKTLIYSTNISCQPSQMSNMGWDGWTQWYKPGIPSRGRTSGREVDVGGQGGTEIQKWDTYDQNLTLKDSHCIRPGRKAALPRVLTESGSITPWYQSPGTQSFCQDFHNKGTIDTGIMMHAMRLKEVPSPLRNPFAFYLERYSEVPVLPSRDWSSLTTSFQPEAV